MVSNIDQNVDKIFALVWPFLYFDLFGETIFRPKLYFFGETVLRPNFRTPKKNFTDTHRSANFLYARTRLHESGLTGPHHFSQILRAPKPIFSGIIIDEIIEKITTLKIPDVCILPIFHELKPMEKSEYHILFQKGQLCRKRFCGIFF